MKPEEFFKSFTCPFCRKLSAFNTYHGGQVTIMGDIGAKVYLCQNQLCNDGAVLALTDTIPGMGNRDRFHEPVELLWPRPAPRDISADAPPTVRDLFEEGAQCHAIGAIRAAAAMYRATVEKICDEKGIPRRENGRKLDLFSRIERLPVTDEEREDLHAARIVGNDSVHEGVEYDALDVDFLAGLIEGVAYTLWEVPAQRKRFRDNLARTKEAYKAQDQIEAPQEVAEIEPPGRETV